MQHHVVEGEPGIFPAPVADVLRRLGRWAERRLPGRGGDRRTEAPGERAEPDAPDR